MQKNENGSVQRSHQSQTTANSLCSMSELSIQPIVIEDLSDDEFNDMFKNINSNEF